MSINRAWTSTLEAAKNGQLSLFKDKIDKSVAVLELDGTRRVVQKARSTQWTSYGLSVVLDELNINVDKCSTKNMHDYDIVLYSITSPTDILVMADEMPIINRSDRQRSKTRIVAGGQGAYSIWALRDIVDRVHFGRADGCAKQVCLTDDVTQYQYNATLDYSIENKYLVRGFKKLGPLEDAVGCRMACAFCQYTYTHEFVRRKSSEHYNPGRQGHRVTEDTFVSLDLTTPGRKTTAFDGWSESTRKRVHKGLTDKYIAQKLRTATEAISGTIVLKVFQIVGYPWETSASINNDIEHMRNVLASADNQNKTPGRMVIMFLNTPFSPEPLTPMQDAPAAIHVNWRNAILGCENRGRNVYKGTNIEAFILPQISGPLTLLKRVAVNRGATIQQLRLLNKCKTIDDATSIVPGIWEANAGKRVSNYLSVGFALPNSKQRFLDNGSHTLINPRKDTA